MNSSNDAAHDLRISPLFIVADVPAALAFYRHELGFEVTLRGPTSDDESCGIVTPCTRV